MPHRADDDLTRRAWDAVTGARELSGWERAWGSPLLVFIAVLAGASLGSLIGGIFGGFVAALLAIPTGIPGARG